jgi:hypothetical protein
MRVLIFTLSAALMLLSIAPQAGAAKYSAGSRVGRTGRNVTVKCGNEGREKRSRISNAASSKV